MGCLQDPLFFVFGVFFMYLFPYLVLFVSILMSGASQNHYQIPFGNNGCHILILRLQVCCEHHYILLVYTVNKTEFLDLKS